MSLYAANCEGNGREMGHTSIWGNCLRKPHTHKKNQSFSYPSSGLNLEHKIFYYYNNSKIKINHLKKNKRPIKFCVWFFKNLSLKSGSECYPLLLWSTTLIR